MNFKVVKNWKDRDGNILKFYFIIYFDEEYYLSFCLSCDIIKLTKEKFIDSVQVKMFDNKQNSLVIDNKEQFEIIKHLKDLVYKEL